MYRGHRGIRPGTDVGLEQSAGRSSERGGITMTPSDFDLLGLDIPATAAPPLPQSFTVADSGLALPRQTMPTLLRFAGTYMVLSDYLLIPPSPVGAPPGVLPPELEALLPQLAADMTLQDTLFALAALNHFAHHPEEATPAIQTLRAVLRPEIRARFDNALPRRQVFARQPVMRALRIVLSEPGRAVSSRFPPRDRTDPFGTRCRRYLESRSAHYECHDRWFAKPRCTRSGCQRHVPRI